MMKILAWNIWGLANNPSLRRLKKIFETNKIFCFAIFEPKVSKASIKDYAFKFNCLDFVANLEDNIWVFWKDLLKYSVLHLDKQFISIQVDFAGIIVMISFVHASCDFNTRLSLWDYFINCNISMP